MPSDKESTQKGCYGFFIFVSGSVSVSFWQKTAVSVFRGFSFSIQKMSIALHVTLCLLKTIKPITLCRTIHQMVNIVMFVCKLAVYVMQLLHIKTQKVNFLYFST